MGQIIKKYKDVFMQLRYKMLCDVKHICTLETKIKKNVNAFLSLATTFYISKKLHIRSGRWPRNQTARGI